MAQYIEKSAIVAEIKRQKAQWRICKSSEAKYRREMLDDISSFIDTLEVKEMENSNEAFIEKACEWLKEQDEMIGVSFEEDFIERFKNYMENKL